MENLTLSAVAAVCATILLILNIYNSSKTARRNADEPLNKLDARVAELEKHIIKVDLAMNELHRDVDKAHDKIRETEENTKKQNQALLAILIWIKSNSESNDMKQIDDAIKLLS